MMRRRYFERALAPHIRNLRGINRLLAAFVGENDPRLFNLDQLANCGLSARVIGKRDTNSGAVRKAKGGE